MTIARKLWLGFGVLVLIFVLACLIIFFSERAVNSTLAEVVSVEEPTRAASFEMEINAAEMARDVLDYLDTGDPRYREQFEDNRADFERFKDRYDALTDTERGKRQGERIEALYEEYEKVGDALTGTEPSGGQDGAISSDERRFLELQAELDAVFDEEVQPWHARQLREAESAAEDAIHGVYTALVALLLAGLLVGSLAAYLINRGIIGSISSLREGADRVGRGDLAHRIEVDTTDELGTVAVAFNAMLDRRREAEAALKESEEKFRGLSDASFEGIAIVEDGRVVETNTAFVRMYDYEPSEVLGMSAMDFIAPECREVALRHISSGSEEPHEATGIRKDGTMFDVEARGRTSSYQNRTVRITAIRDITERKEAEEELRKAEQRYRTLVERMPAVVYVQEIGSPDTALYMSPRIEALTGYSPDECQDPDLRWRMVHPEDREGLQSEDEHTVEPGDVFANEYRVLHRDGHTVWVRNESVVVEDEASGSRYWQGFMVDITERKEVEERLRDAEERYRTMVEQIPAATYVQEIDHDLATTFVSPQIENISGYSPQEYTATPALWVGILHPEDRDHVLEEDARTDATGETFEVEYRVLARNGRTVWVHDQAVIVRDAEGHPLFWQGFMQDITERKEAEEELRRSEARIRAIVETTPDAIITMTNDGMVRSFNPSAERIFGYAADEVVGQPLRMLMPERFREVHEAGFRRYLGGGEARVLGKGAVELSGLRKDGTEFPLDLSLGEMREEGDVLFTAIVRDITERKAAELAVRENEERFRQLFDQSVDALLVHDASGRIVDCNAEACRALGYDREELLSLRIQDLATDLVSDRQERPSTEPTLWQRALSGEPGKVAGIHMGEHRRKDGTTFPVEVYVGSVDYGGERMIFASARDITERKRAEEALWRSEERYRLVAQATNEVIWDNDLTTNAQVWDGATEAMFGYSPEEMGSTAEWWEDHIHPEDRERVLANTEAVLRDDREAWTDEYRFRRADGAYVTLVDQAYVVRDAEGRPVRMLGSIMDVTERRRAEENLRESEKRYRTLVETVQEGIAFIAPDGGVINYCNEAYAGILGFTPEEMVGRSFFDLLEGEEGEKTLRQREMRHEGVSSSYEVTATAADGTKKILSATGSPIYDAEGTYAGAVQTIVDVTERRRAEKELREAEELFRSAFDDAAVGMALNDLDGRFMQVNRSLCEMLGYTEEELLRLTFEDISHPDDLEISVHKLGELLAGEIERYGLEKRYLHADGHPVWVALSVSAVRDQEGNPLYRIAQIQDITERKEAEAQLRKSQASLAEAQRMAHIGSWDYDLTTGRITWSDEVFRIYGHEPQAFTPDFDRLLEVVHPDDRYLIGERMDGALYRDEPYDFEHRIVLPDGTERIVYRTGRVVRDEGGRPLRLLGTVQDITERQRAEQEIRELNESLERRVEERTAELRESEERYSLVVEGSNDGIFDWDMVEDTLFWNDRLFEILGLSRQAFTPTLDAFFELVHPEDREKVSESLTAHLERGEEFDVELRMRHAGGEYRTCMARGKAQRDEDGRPFRMAGTVTDITERKRAEEALRLLAEASAELSTSLDYQATLTGIARLAVPKLADWCAVDILDEDGSLERLAVVHQDPQKVELARDLEKRYPTDPEAPRGLHHVLRTGRPEFYPEIPDEMLELGARDDEHLRIMREIGFSSAIVVPITARARTLGTITLVSAESGRRYGEADLRLAEDLARRSASAVDNAKLYEAAQKELAERKRAEEEIRRLNESLENRVEERTAQLQNAILELERAGENLRRAKEEAESANRAKSEFLANMSHEIRTPMNGVIGMTELLLGTPLSDEQRECAGTIRLSGESLLSILNDILDFSKIEAGEMRLETVDFDLRMAVEEVVALFAERAHKKDLELASLVDYDVPTALQGDPGRVRQILTNLIGNAIKFTESGEVVLRAELAEEDPERATVRISVKDTGIGMTEEQQTRIFQSFSQADASTTRRYGGTGLGLTISRQMVELMGGEIGVESEPGVGSTFFFTLPLIKQPGEARRAPGPVADLTNLRVLIVDDNKTNRQILHKQLSSWGMESREVGDGFAALEALRSAALEGASYNLAILDMQMPEMDGMQLARQISGDPAISSTRLVLLTSIGQRGDGDEALQAGIEAYLTKPVRQSELYDAIATVMGTPESAGDERSILITRHTLREMHTGVRAHLLLAEDNPVNQKVAARMLERLGYRVDVAQNGREALEALARHRYAAILMDVQMPEMDGYEATAEIRRQEAALAWQGEDRNIPIIAMTANAMQGDREKAIAAGMDDYLAKPVRQEKLEEILGRWVSRGAAEAPPNGAPDGATGREANGEDRPLDPEVLASLRELGDAELLSELAEMFLDDVSSRLSVLRGAIEDGNTGAVEQTAHTLKGSSGNMGARRMSGICAEIEASGASGGLARTPELLESLEAEFGRVRRALEAELERGS